MVNFRYKEGHNYCTDLDMLPERPNSYPTSHKNVVKWVAQGNTIQPYDPYDGATLADAKATKKATLKRKAKKLFRENVDDLYAEYYREGLRGNSSTLPDSTVTDYEDALRTAFSNAKTDINALTTNVDIDAYEVTWPTPPE